MKKLQWVLSAALMGLAQLTATAQQQDRPAIAVTTIDCRADSKITPQAMTYMVRLELEKTGLYSVMDRYEVDEIMARERITTGDCFSRSCLVATGRALGVSKVLSGSIDRLGAKLVITLRLVDVATGTAEKTIATEYLDLPELQKMVRISVQKIAGLTPDPVIASQLTDYDVPIQSPKNAFKLNGPRIGFSYTMGEAGRIAQAVPARGGFGMFPVAFEFGWQQEVQYISAGSFHALVENIFMIGGLESGRCIPSYTPLLGFRFGKNAWEFGFGPTFRAIQKAEGFFDADGLIGPRNVWHLQKDWANSLPGSPFPVGYDSVKRLDSRGDLAISTGLVIALGRTFHSGYLNIPVNVYVVPRRDGTSAGATFGFNIQKKDRRDR